MQIYVVMSNDFPHKVFKTLKRAEGYIDGANEINNERQKQYGGSRIFYKIYEFELQQ